MIVSYDKEKTKPFFFQSGITWYKTALEIKIEQF